ncbi:NUDIX domain-containing protein [Patescibacteria group bacterium]|nr:NUDIX domain-containing protein [Patescibacteria group bacterium]
MAAKSNEILIGGTVLFKDSRGKRYFLVVKQGEDSEWELPKITVRRGESSVRAVIRMTGEMAGMNARVLEEAGRFSGVVTINGKVLTQRSLYYLMVQKAGGSELIGFEKSEWMDYGKAAKKLGPKREKDILKQGKEVLKEWEKAHKKQK